MKFVLPHKSGLLFYSVRYQNFLLYLGKTCLTNQHQLSLGRPENTNIKDEHTIRQKKILNCFSDHFFEKQMRQCGFLSLFGQKTYAVTFFFEIATIFFLKVLGWLFHQI